MQDRHRSVWIAIGAAWMIAAGSASAQTQAPASDTTVYPASHFAAFSPRQHWTSSSVRRASFWSRARMCAGLAPLARMY